VPGLGSLHQDALVFHNLLREVKDEVAAAQSYRESLRSTFAERRWIDLSCLLQHVKVEVLRLILTRRNQAHYLRANACRESFLLGKRFAALKGIAMKATWQ
jgi:hypothetical protein